jgi:hypothetical protein
MSELRRCQRERERERASRTHHSSERRRPRDSASTGGESIESFEKVETL